MQSLIRRTTRSGTEDNERAGSVRQPERELTVAANLKARNVENEFGRSAPALFCDLSTEIGGGCGASSNGAEGGGGESLLLFSPFTLSILKTRNFHRRFSILTWPTQLITDSPLDTKWTAKTR